MKSSYLNSNDSTDNTSHLNDGKDALNNHSALLPNHSIYGPYSDGKQKKEQFQASKSIMGAAASTYSTQSLLSKDSNFDDSGAQTA